MTAPGHLQTPGSSVTFGLRETSWQTISERKRRCTVGEFGSSRPKTIFGLDNSVNFFHPGHLGTFL